MCECFLLFAFTFSVLNFKKKGAIQIMYVIIIIIIINHSINCSFKIIKWHLAPFTKYNIYFITVLK